MYRLFPRHRDEGNRPEAEMRWREPAEARREAPDPYRGAPLGVECAWPPIALREVTRTLM